MKISINNPCHENWDNMNPNEQGAFCLACHKNVIDFSKKTVTEIKEFFTAVPDTEKVCGRFEEKQLDELTFDDFFQRFKSWHFVKKAAIVIYIMFGLTLFSCKPSQEVHKMGEAVAISDTVQTTGIENSNETGILKGDIAFVPDTSQKHLLGEPAVVKEETQHLKGKVKVRK